MASTTNNNRHRWHSGECWNANLTICIRWTLPIRFENPTYIGHGSTGAVIKAMDTMTNRMVAIKILPRPSSRPPCYKRIYRELKLLTFFNHPDTDVVQLYNVFTPDQTLQDFQTLYLVMNFFDDDLNGRIRKRKQDQQPFTESEVRHIIHSILRAVKLLHSANIMHRDIKPQNIGIAHTDDVALLDFGLACAGSSGLKTGYVMTRWWRAPEVIVNWEKYDEKVDVWAIGCIMAELLRLGPLFPSKDHLEHLQLIVQLVGTPDQETLEKTCEENARKYIQQEMQNVPSTDFHGLFPTLSESGIDFLKGLLRFDPEKRSTVEEALDHPFLNGNRHVASERTEQPIQDIHMYANYPNEQWKALIWQLIQEFQEPTWAVQPVAIQH